MAFGDVNLQTDSVRGKYAGSPGGGGWPTIRVYNKATGYDGAFAGDWKDKNGLSGAMCDVFGNEENMQKYVEELGSTSLCSVVDGAGCSEKEMQFIEKWKGQEGVDAQLTRLTGMAGSSMKVRDACPAPPALPLATLPCTLSQRVVPFPTRQPDLKKWLSQRIAILKQLANAPKEEL